MTDVIDELTAIELIYRIATGQDPSEDDEDALDMIAELCIRTLPPDLRGRKQ